MTVEARQILSTLMKQEDIGEVKAYELMQQLAEGIIDAPMAGSLLIALRIKGETAAEVRGFANAMRDLATSVAIDSNLETIDIVGTGGDGSNSFNLSTGTALLAAASGLNVTKHGNRSVSSQSGSSDLLDALGIALASDPAKIKTIVEKTGFVFLFAPFFHPAMKNIAPIRQALGVRTVFNILGPLTNPTQPSYYLLGAFSSPMAKLMAEALSGMSIKRAFVIHGVNGWDEPTPISEFELYDVSPGRVNFSIRDPQDFGIPRCKALDLLGGDPKQNATALMDVFKGIDQGAHLNSLLLGAGLALELSGKAINLEEGITQARNAIEQGTALDLIQKLQTLKD
jgi:anthranilate phosphoribosyltransferase